MIPIGLTGYLACGFGNSLFDKERNGNHQPLVSVYIVAKIGRELLVLLLKLETFHHCLKQTIFGDLK
jgi:hypothetical protein